ncbi:MAG: hypothetical protein OER88_04500, partial [Planctomycetota bacterium]|nr:hypothetical protein [Planctomycetota bacterium]
MFGRTASSKPSSSLPVVGALTVLVLASMAVAIPPAAIERPAAEVECGLLVGHGRITSQLAEHAARNGYSYLAVDFTTASFDDDALWREYFTEISLRQFPIWGW